MAVLIEQITVPIYDAPYTIEPSPNAGSNAVFSNTGLVPVVSPFASPGVRAPIGNIWGEESPVSVATGSLYLQPFNILKANGYFGFSFGSNTLRYRAFNPPQFFGNQIFQMENNSSVGNTQIGQLYYWNAVLNGIFNTNNNVGLISRVLFNYSTNAVGPPMGNGVWYSFNCVMTVTGEAPYSQYTMLFTYFNGFPNSLCVMCGVAKSPSGYQFTNAVLIDATATFDPAHETISAAFCNATIKNNYAGAACNVNGTANTFMSLYQNGVGSPVYFRFYSSDPIAGGNYLGQVDPSTIPGLSPARVPDALCSLGYLWVSSTAGQAIVLTPDGAGYYVITLAPQSANATTALSYNSMSANGNAPAIMGDADGIFWVASNAVNSGYMYIGNGITNLLQLTPPVALQLPAPVSLPCFDPCSPNFPVFGSNK